MAKDEYGKKIMGTFINAIIVIFKWLCFIFFVVNIGLTIGLLVMMLMNQNDIANDLLTTMMKLLTYFNKEQIMFYISSIGKIKLAVDGIGYGLAVSIKYGLIYSLVAKFQKIFSSILDGDMYTKKNVDIINEALPLTCFIAFVQPVIMYFIIECTGVFDYSDIDVSGIIFIIATYILKLAFEKGYELEELRLKYGKDLSNMKVRENEKQMDELKKEMEIKKKAKEVKEVVEPVKVEEKKETPKPKTTKKKKSLNKNTKKSNQNNPKKNTTTK